jgi:signal transduction histidine kinase
VSIKWRLCGYLAAFVLVLLALLWLSQTVFLDKFYKSIKTNTVKNAAAAVVRGLSTAKNAEEFTSLLDRVSRNADACIRIVNNRGMTLYSVETTVDCTIHKMLPGALQRYFRTAEHQGAVMDFFERYPAYDINIAERGTIAIKPSGRARQNLIAAQTAALPDGTTVLVLLDSAVTPVDATVQTLRVQLTVITLVLLLLAVLLAVYLSRKISAPIIRLNAGARELAQGNYETRFDGRGYREIAELSDILNHAATELAKVETLRRELIANVSHDLRTPLTMIKGYGEVMRDLPGENTATNVQVIIDEAERLSRLVSDLLDLSRLQAGAQEITPRIFNLTRNLRLTLERFSRLTEQSGYRIDFAAEEEVFVSADEMKISQVLYNLISNAIHYTGPDRIVRIRQTVEAERGAVRVAISNSGEGIAPEHLPYIWDRYYRIDKTHRQLDTGSGLGLFIVKNVLQAHAASFGVESANGNTTFWFELPRAAALTVHNAQFTVL